MAANQGSNYGDYLTNPSNPLYLHASETPSQALVSPPLNGRNYHAWARAMKLALLSKNKLKLVDGSFLPPSPTDPVYGAWERCNNMVLAWIHRSIDDSILQSILWIDQASEVWNDLRDRFSQADMFRISDLQEELYRMQQGTLTISQYFTQLKSLWDEFENYRPVITCKCSIPCTYGATQSYKKYRDQDYVIRFLKGLNEQFSHVRSQIMLLDPLPSINKAFSLVVQQERQMSATGVIEFPSDTKAFAANSDQYTGYGKGQGNWGRGGGTTGRGQGTSNKRCTHCGMTNHTVDTCYFKHGFPPGYKPRQKNANAVISNKDCTSEGGSQNQLGGAIPSIGFT